MSESVIYEVPPTPQKNFYIPRLLKILFAATVSVLTLSLIVTVYLIKTQPELITPLATTAKILGLNITPEKPNKIVYGFLPYWNLQYYAQIPYQHLTHLALFGVNVEADGHIQKIEQNYQIPYNANPLPCSISHLKPAIFYLSERSLKPRKHLAKLLLFDIGPCQNQF